MPFNRITVDPDRLGARPCIRGLRITVESVVRPVAAGWTSDEILDEYPDLEADDIAQVLEHAPASTRTHYRRIQTPA